MAQSLATSDLVLAVGSSLSPDRFSHAIPDAVKKTIIHCNVDELHINKMYPTAQAVIGDARLTLQTLLKEVADQTASAGRPAYLECLCCQYPVYGQWVGRSME